MLPEYFILLSSSNSVAGPIVFISAVAICIILWRRDKKKKAEAERWRKNEEHEQAAGMKSSIKIPEIHLLEREEELFWVECRAVSSPSPLAIYWPMAEGNLQDIVKSHGVNTDNPVPGTLHITDRRYVLDAGAESFDLPYSRIRSIEGFEDGLAVLTENKDIFLFMDSNDAAISVSFIEGLEKR